MRPLYNTGRRVYKEVGSSSPNGEVEQLGGHAPLTWGHRSTVGHIAGSDGIRVRLPLAPPFLWKMRLTKYV